MDQTHHIIKIDKCYYDRVVSGQKTFEIRLNDRDYQVGDRITMETDVGTQVSVVITYLSHYPAALKDGWVAFSFTIDY